MRSTTAATPFLSMPEPDATANPEALLVADIRRGKPEAWAGLIAEYEGRLLAFVRSRLGPGRSSADEDIVQETLIGFLHSLPNYDPRRPLEGWLFTIAAHKLTDHLRREGRRPAVTLSSGGAGSGSGAGWDLPGDDPRASTIARGAERRRLEEGALASALGEHLDMWRERGEWPKVMAMELLFVNGRGNKEVAELVGLSEQQVANFKFDFLANLKKRLMKLGLDEEVFPELSA